MKPSIIITMAILLAGCSGIYEPCETKDDCDLELTDGCAHILGGPPSFCSVLCQEAKDCPEGPNGEAPSCIPVGVLQVCSI